MTPTRVLNGRYELSEPLGRGGMADVYLGRDIRLGRTVAVKLLRADLARDPQFQARFRREAQAVAGLNHPSIVAVYDTGEFVPDASPDGARVPYIVMEFVQGRTLRDLIRAKELSIDAAIDYTLGVLSALDYSHRAGIVHRDIKPANVMVTGDSSGTGHTVKVMDFGIARAIADSSATMTQTQAVIGTAQYLSPEQARGEAVDARSDLYSAACLLYEMLAGRPPFMGDSPVSVAYQHVRETAEVPSHFNAEVSPALDSVLIRGLQKNRADRFQDAAAFRRALRAAKNGVALTPYTASEAPTDPDATVAVPSMASRAAAARIANATAPPAVGRAAADAPVPRGDKAQGSGGEGDESARPPGEEPVTRAMAKVLGGGPLTTGPADDEDPDAMPLGLPPERDVDPHARRRRRAWIATLCIFVVLILGAGSWLGYNLLTAKPPEPVMVHIPDVATLSEPEALTRLFNAGLKPSADHEYDAKVPKGEAVGTDPASGEAVQPDTTIRLIISNGPATIAIPQTANLTEAAARDVVSAAGLVAGKTTLVPSGSIGSGMVVSTSPAGGQVVGSGATVDFNVSNGKVVMPALIGLTKDAATAAVAKASPTLTVTFVPKDNSVVEPGRVTQQSTEAGQPVDQGSTITVEIARKPAPPPVECPTSPAPSATAAPSPTATASPAPSTPSSSCAGPSPTGKG